MNEWIKEVIIERYEALSEKAESKSELKALKDKAAAYSRCTRSDLLCILIS